MRIKKNSVQEGLDYTEFFSFLIKLLPTREGILNFQTIFRN